MLLRLARNFRPHALRNCRSFCSKKDIPVTQVQPSRRDAISRQRSPFQSVFSKRPWWQLQYEAEKEMDDFMGNFYRRSGFDRPEEIQVTHNKSVFEVKLVLHNFTLEELKVKLTDNRLRVSGKHEQKEDDHGHITREFHREFKVPMNVDLGSMTSTFSEDSVLTIRANVNPAKEHEIEIERENSSK